MEKVGIVTVINWSAAGYVSSTQHSKW